MKIIEAFLKHRDAFAISMVFASGPLNYALRDGVGLAPNNSLFSLAFMFGGIFLLLPFRNFKTLYRNDTPLIPLAIAYILLTLVYMYIHPHKYVSTFQVIYDTVVIFIVLYFLFFLMTVRESTLRLNFLKIIIWLTFIGCIGLLIFVFLNPNFILGQRLAISYGTDSEMEAMGNPHTFGRGAFFGLVAAIVYLKYEIKKIPRLLTYMAMSILFAVLILAQAMSSIIAGFLFFLLFTWYNSTFISLVKKAGGLLKKWYVWLVIVLMAVKGIDYINKNRVIVDLAYNMVERRVESLINTFIPSESEGMFEETVSGDESASMRVVLLGKVWEQLVENMEEGKYLNIIFGNGYYALYTDVPFIEVFNSYGIVGMLLFAIFFWLMIKYCLKEMKRPTSIISEFTAYGFVYFFVFTFTNGLIMDYTRWTFFIMVCRFLPPLYTKLNNKLVDKN